MGDVIISPPLCVSMTLIRNDSPRLSTDVNCGSSALSSDYRKWNLGADFRMIETNSSPWEHFWKTKRETVKLLGPYLSGYYFLLINLALVILPCITVSVSGALAYKKKIFASSVDRKFQRESNRSNRGKNETACGNSYWIPMQRIAAWSFCF